MSHERPITSPQGVPMCPRCHNRDLTAPCGTGGSLLRPLADLKHCACLPCCVARLQERDHRRRTR